MYDGTGSHSLLDGSRIYYMCHKGFTLVGESVRTCLHGQWTGSTPICQEGQFPLGCVQPKKIDHGDYTFLKHEGTGFVPDGSKVFYTCHTGFRFEDDNESPNIICRNGQWQGLVPNCGKFHPFICWYIFLLILLRGHQICKRKLPA